MNAFLPIKIATLTTYVWTYCFPTTYQKPPTRRVSLSSQKRKRGIERRRIKGKAVVLKNEVFLPEKMPASVKWA
jgi:hypothetical protein